MKEENNTYEMMTQTPVSRLIIKLSIPTILSMLVTNIYNLVDTAFVGLLGTSASGAVGIVFGFMSIIQAVGFLFGQGAGSLLSRSLGKRNVEEASRYTSTGFYDSFICGILITVIGFISLDRTVYFLGSTPTIAPYAKTYISCILISAPFMATSLTLNNMLRYEGKATLGTIGLLTGAVLNIIGDPILMFGFKLGILGAGISTAFSQLVSWGILISMYILKKTESTLSIKLVEFSDFRRVYEIFTTGFPSLLRQGLTSISTVIQNYECSFYGDAAVAALSIVSRIFFFAFSIVLGVGQGFQPVSGFNYGAKKYARLRKAYQFTLILTECIMIIESILIFYFSGSLIQIFRDDPRVIQIGTRALRLYAVSQIAMPPCMTTEMLFQSIGKRLDATILSSLRNGVLFIPALLILARLRGLKGIEESQPLAIVLSLPVMIPFAVYFFKKLPKEDVIESAA